MAEENLKKSIDEIYNKDDLRYCRKAVNSIAKSLYLTHSELFDPLPEASSTIAESLGRSITQKEKAEKETKGWRELKEYYLNHLTWRLQYPKKIFGQKLVCSWIIIFLVVFLILGGLFFSGLQLYSALKLGKLSGLQTEMAIETAGKLSFRSSLVGASILVISLIFFYLYLKYVFSIQYPIPPHIGIKDTDAPSFFEEKK